MDEFCRQFKANGSCRYGDQCRYKHVQSSEKSDGANAKKKTRSRKRAPKKAADPPKPARDYIAEFFAAYPEYTYDPTAAFMDEFHAMCNFYKWPEPKKVKKHPARDRAQDLLKDAMVLQFNRMYGKDVRDLGAWQNLCRALGVEPVPETMKACRKVVEGMHVNICDFLDAPTLGAPRDFGSEAALAAYTMNTGKIFPRSNVHAGSLLVHLLRHIFGGGARRRVHAYAYDVL